MLEPKKKLRRISNNTFVNVATRVKINGNEKWLKLYLPCNLPKKNDKKVRMKDESPRGDMERKSNNNPDAKPKIIAKEEPLLIATKVI